MSSSKTETMLSHESPREEGQNQLSPGQISEVSSAHHHGTRHNIERKNVPLSESKSNDEPQQTWLRMRTSETIPKTPGPSDRLKSFSDILVAFAVIVLLPISAAVFAAESVQLSAIANEQSQVANQLTLLSLCYGNLVSVL
jgi:hypothetical protein